jgi:hypothetical protein
MAGRFRQSLVVFVLTIGQARNAVFLTCFLLNLMFGAGAFLVVSGATAVTGP